MTPTAILNISFVHNDSFVILMDKYPPIIISPRKGVVSPDASKYIRIRFEKPLILILADYIKENNLPYSIEYAPVPERGPSEYLCLCSGNEPKLLYITSL